MTIEPKLMSAEEIRKASELARIAHRDYGAFSDTIRSLLAHIAAQDRRIAELEAADRASYPFWLKCAVQKLHEMVDQTDPGDPIGVALTRAGLERKP